MFECGFIIMQSAVTTFYWLQVPIPDLAGRKEIFDYYLGKIKKGDDVDKTVLSRGTTGFTGMYLLELCLV